MTSQSRVIWRRRAALMAVVGLAVAIPITLVIRDGGDEDPEAATQPVTSVPPQPETGPDLDDPGLGVSYRVPEGWDEVKEASAIQLTSPDESAQVVIAAPAPAADAETVLDETLAAFESQYEDVKIAPGSGRKVGGLEAKGAVVQASRGDQELRILVAVAAGEERAYLVEVFTIGGVSGQRLREAQAALNAIEFND